MMRTEAIRLLRSMLNAKQMLDPAEEGPFASDASALRVAITALCREGELLDGMRKIKDVLDGGFSPKKTHELIYPIVGGALIKYDE